MKLRLHFYDFILENRNFQVEMEYYIHLGNFAILSYDDQVPQDQKSKYIYTIQYSTNSIHIKAYYKLDVYTISCLVIQLIVLHCRLEVGGQSRLADRVWVGGQSRVEDRVWVGGQSRLKDRVSWRTE